MDIVMFFGLWGSVKVDVIFDSIGISFKNFIWIVEIFIYVGFVLNIDLWLWIVVNVSIYNVVFVVDIRFFILVI